MMTPRSVRVDDELWDAAMQAADAQGDNLGDVIRQALARYRADWEHKSDLYAKYLDAFREYFPELERPEAMAIIRSGLNSLVPIPPERGTPAVASMVSYARGWLSK